MTEEAAIFDVVVFMKGNKMRALTAEEVEQVNGGTVPAAIFAGLVIGTLVVGAYVLWDSTNQA